MVNRKEAEVSFRVVHLRLDIRPEEVRAALGHAAPLNYVSRVKIDDNIVNVFCSNVEGKLLIQKNWERVKKYSETFLYCEFVDSQWDFICITLYS